MQRVLIWRTAAFLSLLWLLPIFLIRAQTYDNSDLQTIFESSANCSAPCFMGIQPGQTSISDVLRILSHSDWVEPDAYDDPAFVIYNVLDWRWSKDAPRWIDQRQHATVALGSRYVGLVIVETTLRWGDLVLALGMPDQYHLARVSETIASLMDTQYQHEGWYADKGLLVYAGGSCWDARRGSVYDWPVVLHFRAAPPDFAPDSVPTMTGCR